MIGNKIADKITRVLKKSAKELHNNDETEVDVERATPKEKIYISKLRTTNYWWIKISTKKRCIFLETTDELMLTLKNIHIPRKKTTNYWWVKVIKTI